MNVPKFITFTGADEHADVDGMLALSRSYPIEWGILFSPTRQGVEPRYPRLDTLQRFADASPLQLSAHLCGGYSAAVVEFGGLPIYRNGGFDLQAFLQRCRRVQINTSARQIPISDIQAWATGLGLRAILQSRSEHTFPVDDRCDWLFDRSGGRGISPGEWPRPSIGSTTIHGYAGGLKPDNVAQSIELIEWEAGPNYWIDMETGVRDADDRFDLDKCEAVCRAVYGVRYGVRP